MTQGQNKTHRAREQLLQAGRDYPTAWQAAEGFRRDKGQPNFDWPDWCYLPLAGAYAVVSGGGANRVPLHKIGDVSRLGAMMAWRMTQGIYRFDPAVYEAVRDTPLGGELPVQAIMQLPEWCVYVETPDMTLGEMPLYGFWAHLEHDMNAGRIELRLLLDSDELVPVPIHLGHGSLADCVLAASQETSRQSGALGIPFPISDAAAVQRAWAEPLVSLLLYLCATNDYSRRGKPGMPANPAPTRTRRDGMRIFAAPGPSEWDVGVRMGAALRAAYQAQETGQSGSHSGPRGHVRRAHWHGFRSGPMKRDDGSEIPAEQRKFELRWLPPIAVNLPDVGDMPSTIRPVK
ncbi:AcrVA2 family anti-CRISPR protein [Achromobacter anxifer]|uniref:AcrVA2 family anti-CRISPR protein n=1 Tax=Achromobacter anxifer TaxID=1287737 RepID=UPI0023F6A68D|nr:hypothetical protein [Achromobacter anxifer]MDF8361343.1 hypothetical protein [Achromobacter anxifer]